MNIVVISGRVSTKPELSYTPQTQTACCRFNVAVKKRKAKEGEQDVFFIRVTVWGKQAENCEKWLEVGQNCMVNGSIKVDNYTDKNGVKREATEITADFVEFGAKPSYNQTAPTQAVGIQQTIDDVPFMQTNDAPPF